MMDILRFPYTLCCRVCISWKRNLVAYVFAFIILSFCVFILHSIVPRTRKVYKTLTDRDSFFAQDGVLPREYNPSIFFHTAKGRENASQSHSLLYRLYPDLNKSRYKNGTAPCSLFTNESSRGPIEADVVSVPSNRELEDSLSDKLQLGGHFIPQKCRSKQRVAVIVPYRDRSVHLKMFLKHMHPFLQRQNLEYYIVVVEQAEGELFNRALLFNIGFHKMNSLHHIDCFIFQDVDLLPLDDRIFYLCQDQPVHLSMLVDTLGDSLMYDFLFGGVVALTPEMMTKVNGFSNLYYGWGGEDDDMSYRIRSHGYHIERHAKEVARYTMMKHGPEEDVNQDKLNRQVEGGRDRIHEDGLNTLVFHLLEFQPLPLYTWIYIKPNRSTSWEDAGVN